MQTCLLLWLLLGMLVQAPPAQAFGDLFRFADTAAVGGGGGRFFTGSNADGYSCRVCHGDTPFNGLLVSGLPKVYQPGITYDVAIQLPLLSEHATALVELTDTRGFGAGNAWVPSERLTVAEACEPADQGVPATLVLLGPDLPILNGRQLIGLQDCGAHALHFYWTAPAVDVGPVTFAGGAVAADGQGDAAGDAVTRFFFQIASPTQQQEISVAGTCSIVTPGSTHGRAYVWLLTLMAAAALRRRSRTRATAPATRC